MSRTPEIEEAIREVYAPVGEDRAYYAHVLAAEVERLEKRLDHSHGVWRNEHDRAKAVETRYAASQDALTEAMGELTEARDRVAELETARQDLLGKIVGWQDGARTDRARIADLDAQNARLREALTPFAAMEEEVSDWPAGAGVEIEECILEGHESFCVEDVRNAANALAETKGTP